MGLGLAVEEEGRGDLVAWGKGVCLGLAVEEEGRVDLVAWGKGVRIIAVEEEGARGSCCMGKGRAPRTFC